MLRTLVFATSLALANVSAAQVTPGAGTEGLAPLAGLVRGSGFVVAGTGMIQGPSSITIDVPLGVTVKQVIALWAGQDNSDAGGDDSIELDGKPVNGTLVGGPSLFFQFQGQRFYTYTYRADVTALGLITPGANNVSVSGMNFQALFAANKGASLVVVYDDGSAADLQLREGSDNAFGGFAGALQSTAPQVFEFAPSTASRTARLELIVAAVLDNAESVVSLQIDDAAPTLLSSILGSADGPEWDTVSLSVAVPAGARKLTVQLLSADVPGENPLASVTWVGAAFSLGVPAAQCTKNLGPKFWLENQDLWKATGLAPADKVATVFGLCSTFSAAHSSHHCHASFSRRYSRDCETTLAQALAAGGGRGRVGFNRALLRHGIAALLNARHPGVRYPLTPDQVVRVVRYGLLDTSYWTARYYAWVLAYYNYRSEYCPN
ncbi:MAG: hypothetical protein KDC87_07010 [Planctomycetes bacterium]|nr:hypothetical protein [Planctomycetota bacterium]MCB9872042.1 hypothetical protein [Planctomycetota bacterium]MCB9888444.1 hypothetical protein [Planctomycetota bacterium]